MAAAFKGAISFGLVHIPISLYTATQDSDIHFNQLCRDDKSQIKYKKVCAHYGKEITANDIVKGFEYEKDKYIIMTEDDFEKAKSEKDRGIHILHFTDLESIRPIYCEKTYRAVPETGGGKAFELLRHAMKNEGKVAIAKTVIGTQEKTYVIMYQKVEIKSTKNNKGGSYYEWKKCSRAYTSECNGSKCTIWGTSRCVEGVPMPGKCNNAYTSKCNKGLCALFGTSRCVDGVVREMCERAYTSECNGSKCSIWGTSRCVDGIPVAGTCSNGYTSKCDNGLCALFGTPKCVDGKVK